MSTFSSPRLPLAEAAPTEFTLRGVLVGTALGLVFGASSLYLVLRVGMTVSASIPVAVLAVTIFRALWTALGLRQATIQENNITQCAGSAGESIAFGVGVTMPALLLLGFEMTVDRIMTVSLLGGVLGILMMIPLRRVFIVGMHGVLKYPEGTACAAVLKAGEDQSSQLQSISERKIPKISGATVFIGFGIAFAHKFFTEVMGIFKTTVSLPLTGFSKAASVASDMASELLGVGYVIGLRTSAVMMAGAVMGGLVIAPTIFLEGEKTGLDPDSIYGGYLRFIGAGCVAAAGILSMFKTLPLIVRSLLAPRTVKMTNANGERERTDRDLPPTVVLGGSLALLAALTWYLSPNFGWLVAALAAVLVLVFGFLFVTVSSRLTGEIGSSSNPISGMTVATLLLTCVIFLLVGLRSAEDAVLALTIGAIVCIAASNGGTTSQDLKTGFLVRGTPLWQQIAITIGAVTSAIVIGFTLLLLAATGTVYTQRDLPQENVAAQLPTEPEVMTYQGKSCRVYRPEKNLKYLVDDSGYVAYRVDPTITGVLKRRDVGRSTTDLPNVPLAADVLAKLPTFTESDGEKRHVYRIFTEEAEEGKTPREYLVDDQGRFLARLETEAVKMKFEAPKTQVMAVIVNGLLDQKLNWGLILIGAFVSIALELCGVSSLAFAVGLYIPMQYSAPIFIGGLVRWGVDVRTTPPHSTAGESASDEANEIVESETSPGMLLASGFIAGGSLAGVTGAFLELGSLPYLEWLEQVTKFLQWGNEDQTWVAALCEKAHLASWLDPALALGLFALLAGLLLWVGLRRPSNH
jgi:putative OPT family oligopeptide transporter